MCVPSCNVTLLQNGMYLRNGPGVWEVGDGSALGHLFDGYATLVRVSFRRGRAAAARVGRLQSRQGARPPAPARVRPLPHHQAGKPGGSSEGRRRARHRQGAVGQRQRRRASGRGRQGAVPLRDYQELRRDRPVHARHDREVPVRRRFGWRDTGGAPRS